jgi:hypothetical protein
MLAEGFREVGATGQADLEARRAEFARIYPDAHPIGRPTADAVLRRWSELGGEKPSGYRSFPGGPSPRETRYHNREEFPADLAAEAETKLEADAFRWWKKQPKPWREKWEPWSAQDRVHCYLIAVATETRLPDDEEYVRSMARILWHEFRRSVPKLAARMQQAAEELDAKPRKADG